MKQPNHIRTLLQARGYPQLLSFVIPMFNEELVVPYLRDALEQFMMEIKGATEVILVNDGSSDSTLFEIAEWARSDPRIKVVNLSRNFGHQAAATAGLDYASGDAVVLLDADLQDPLPVIHEMIERYCEGYDVVYGRRIARQGDTRFKRLTAWIFYRLMRSLVHKDLPVDTGDFRLISQHCLRGLQQLRETHRFLRGMVAWVGYPQIGVDYERAARVAGETKYPLRKMLKFAWLAATSFSALPLKFSLLLGRRARRWERRSGAWFRPRRTRAIGADGRRAWSGWSCARAGCHLPDRWPRGARRDRVLRGQAAEGG